MNLTICNQCGNNLDSDGDCLVCASAYELDNTDYERDEIELYDDPPVNIAERFDRWFSRTHIGRLYWRVRYRIRPRELNDIPF